MDPRIGKNGEVEPLVCALTGQAVRGRHAVTFSLTDGYFYRVLSKSVHMVTPELHAEMLALVEAIEQPTEPPKRKKSAE